MAGNAMLQTTKDQTRLHSAMPRSTAAGSSTGVTAVSVQFDKRVRLKHPQGIVQRREQRSDRLNRVRFCQQHNHGYRQLRYVLLELQTTVVRDQRIKSSPRCLGQQLTVLNAGPAR